MDDGTTVNILRDSPPGSPWRVTFDEIPTRFSVEHPSLDEALFALIQVLALIKR